MRKQLNIFREKVKENICKTLTDIYLELNDGVFPNFEEDEEFYIDNEEIGVNIKVDTEVYNTYDDSRYNEKWEISAFIVSLDGDLFFQCDDNELNWNEISTDELVDICEILNKVK